MAAILHRLPDRMGMPIQQHCTRAEYERMTDLGHFLGRRVERIRGEIIDMAAMKEPHACGMALTQEALRVAFGSGHYIRVQVPLCLGPDSDPEPDLAVVPGSPRDYRSAPTSALLVVEVADSSLFFDTTTKAELYAEMQIPEYWVLDLEHRQLLVFRDPAPLAAGGHAFQTHLSLKETDSISPLAAPHATIRIAELLP